MPLPSVPQISVSSMAGRFKQRYGVEPEWVVRAPGRVNLIGEHTDYNDGFVLPMAIDRWVWIAIRRRDDGRVRLWSTEFDSGGTFGLAESGQGLGGWIDYARGTAWALATSGHALVGFDGLVSGDVPVGAGLSSSAALEMAVARAFSAGSDLTWDPLAMARAGQRAENEWIGVSCGIMDQLVSAGGEAGCALLIDCRSLNVSAVRLPDSAAVVVIDTTTRRPLVDSEYNARREQCLAAAVAGGVASLRDLNLDGLVARREKMNEIAFRRARHVLTENERVAEAVAALRDGDLAALGRLMNESHRSLRDDFEVSTPILDAVVQTARSSPGCWGARLTGAGFGGCVVALVARDDVEAFEREVVTSFAARTGLTPRAYLCEAVRGAEIVAPGPEAFGPVLSSPS